MSNARYALKAKLFLWPGESANWYFLPIEKTVGLKIKERMKGVRRGFGSVPVTVTIGRTSWDTSIFPDSHSGSFILPVKAKVRRTEDIEAGDEVTFSIVLRN